MADLRTRPIPVDALTEPPKIRVTFQADCAPCEFTGPGRASSLTALDDFDAHVAGIAHQHSERKIAAAYEAARDALVADAIEGDPGEAGEIEQGWPR